MATGKQWSWNGVLYEDIKTFSADVKRKADFSDKISWVHLLGNLITCPRCGGKSIFVDISWSFGSPFDILLKSICHSSIEVKSANIYHQWCSKEESENVGSFLSWEKGPVLESEYTNINSDISALFKLFLNVNYKF